MPSRAQRTSRRARSKGSSLRWLVVGGAVTAAIMALPTPPGLSPAGQRALAITLLAAVLWTTEALPLAATGLGCVVLLAVTGATRTSGEAFAGFAQPVGDGNLFLGAARRSGRRPPHTPVGAAPALASARPGLTKSGNHAG